MREIECVRVESASPGLDGYFKKLGVEVGLEFKFISWNKPDISQHSPLIVFALPEFLSDLKLLIEERDEKIVVALNSRKDFKLVSELKLHFDKIFGFVDISQEIEYNVPILKNYLNAHFTKNSVSLEKLANDLDKIYEFTKSQLTQIKDFHDRFVKVRVDRFKGLNFTSKFMAGEKSGGEFFDIIQNDQELLFIQAGCDSYHLSSMILSEIENLKDKQHHNDFQSEALSFQKIVSHHANENGAELNYCLMNLNLKTLMATFTLKGKGVILFQDELIFFDKPFKLKLKPTDRLILISEGAIENWAHLNNKKLTKEFFHEHLNLESKELINEFFFEVSRNKAGKFLVYDALMVIINIEESILYQLP
jgi:hypothetical protein